MSKVLFIFVGLLFLIWFFSPTADPLCSEARRLQSMSDSWNVERFRNVWNASAGDQWFHGCFPKLRKTIDEFHFLEKFC
jgi:hypothetical protein